MEKEECCKLLGVSKNYTKKELKHAYQEMSKKYHPDVVGPQNKQYFIKISAAYKALMTKFSKKAMQEGQPSQDPNTSTSREQYKKSLNEIDSEVNRKKINVKEFNKQFENSKQSASNEGFVYDINQNNYKERSKTQFQQEYDNINREIGNSQPIMGSYNPQNFNNYFEQVKRSNTDIDHYTGVGDYDYNQEAVGQYGQEQSMGMYDVNQNINMGDHQAIMYEQPISHQEMQQRLNAYNQESIYVPMQVQQQQPNQPMHQMQQIQQMQPMQPMQPMQQMQQIQQPQQQHRAYYNESWQSMPAQNNQESELLYQISENQQFILKELKNNKKALNNPEFVDKINEISKKQEQLLKKRFN
jgi:curved DNA-binding protein CbpA